MTNLDGKQLRYLIGGNDSYSGADSEVTELSYDAEHPPQHGIGVKYGNLFNEKYGEQSSAERAKYAPYLEQGDTAAEYNEGQIDPAGQGWNKNLDEQFARAKAQGFTIIELDNPDSYEMDDVMGAADRAHAAGLQLLAKNPQICQGDRVGYVAHPAVVGIVVERDCGTPDQMDVMRRNAGKPTLPVWFVAFGSGKSWAERMAEKAAAAQYVNMGVTYCTQGEYRNSTDLLVPVPPAPPETEPVTTVDITIESHGDVRVTVNGQDLTG